MPDAHSASQGTPNVRAGPSRGGKPVCPKLEPRGVLIPFFALPAIFACTAKAEVVGNTRAMSAIRSNQGHRGAPDRQQSEHSSNSSKFGSSFWRVNRDDLHPIVYIRFIDFSSNMINILLIEDFRFRTRNKTTKVIVQWQLSFFIFCTE